MAKLTPLLDLLVLKETRAIQEPLGTKCVAVMETRETPVARGSVGEDLPAQGVPRDKKVIADLTYLYFTTEGCCERIS